MTGCTIISSDIDDEQFGRSLILHLKDPEGKEIHICVNFEYPGGEYEPKHKIVELHPDRTEKDGSDQQETCHI